MLDQIRIVRSGQAESLRHALYMGVDNDAGLAEGIPENDIRRFPADTRQGDQLFHRLGDLFTEAFSYGFAAGDEMFRFVLKETGGTNDLFDLRKMSCSQCCRLPIPPKERWRDLVDALVGALGRKNCGHQQFPRGTMVEFHLRAWHCALECLRNLSEMLSTI